MKRLWILAFLLMPVLAGGCKMCYSWQLGRDRAPEGQPPMLRTALRSAVQFVLWMRRLSAGPRQRKRQPMLPKSCRLTDLDLGCPGRWTLAPRQPELFS